MGQRADRRDVHGPAGRPPTRSWDRGASQISPAKPSINFGVWWDGDPLREILDDVTISKWDWLAGTSNPVLAPTGVLSNNGTKANPGLSGDILGDWREEVVWRESTNDALRVYTTTVPTALRFYTLMHDRQYREAIAWQNTAYNQPPHPGFFLGDGMARPAGARHRDVPGRAPGPARPGVHRDRGRHGRVGRRLRDQRRAAGPERDRASRGPP